MNALTVVVGSTNPVKSRAASEAVRLAFAGPEPLVRQVAAPSGVPDQPYGDEVTRTGALNRARAAREADGQADLWIGLEGGVATSPGNPDGLECMAWAVVLGSVSGSVNGEAGDSGECTQGAARTASFTLPEEIVRLMRSGMELGEATDRVLGVPDGAVSHRHGSGTVGPLTGGALDRAAYYTHALLLALIPFRNPGLHFPHPSLRE